MKTSRVALALCIGLSLMAQEPDERARDAYKESSYQDLVRTFGVGKAFWNPGHVARAPIEVRASLRRAIDRGDESAVLGLMDLIEDLDSLRPDEKILKAQIAYTARFWKEGEKASRDSGLNPLFKALERERRGKTEKGASSSQDLVRSESYALLKGGNITWPPFRTMLLKPEIASILASEDFILGGKVPDGFDADWLTGSMGKAEDWDRYWTQAWASGEPVRISGMLNRMVYYRTSGLSEVQSAEVKRRVETDQAFAYVWADSQAPIPQRYFPNDFIRKVTAARGRTNGTPEAVVELAKVAATPRDHYELSMLLEAQGEEGSLKLFLESSKFLLQDPGVPGWTAAVAQNRVDGVRGRYEQLLAARAEAERQAEVTRKKAEEEERRAERLRRELEARERLEALMNRRVGNAVQAMERIARGHFRKERLQVDSGVAQLGRIVSEFAESDGALNLFKKRVRDAWANGPGASISIDPAISAFERSSLNNLLKQVLDGVKPMNGSGFADE